MMDLTHDSQVIASCCKYETFFRQMKFIIHTLYFSKHRNGKNVECMNRLIDSNCSFLNSSIFAYKVRLAVVKYQNFGLKVFYIPINFHTRYERLQTSFMVFELAILQRSSYYTRCNCKLCITETRNLHVCEFAENGAHAYIRKIFRPNVQHV